MTKYAIIQLLGKQYKVTEGAELTIDRLPQAEGETIKVSDVLLVHDGKTLHVGTPLVSKATVTLTVKGNQAGDKIRVAKYKAKSRYRRVHGHRQAETVVNVAGISV